MLHIILLVLRIIGFLIFALIGLLLLAIVVILVAPVGYKFDLTTGEGEKELWGRLWFYWMRPLFLGEVCYDKGNLKWHIRAGWKKISNTTEKQEVYQKSLDREKETSDLEVSVVKHTATDKEKDSEAGGKTDDRESLAKRKKLNKRRWSFKVFVEKIKYTFQRMCDNIKVLVKKKEALERFLKNEIHKNAFLKILKELKQFLRRMCPKKVDVKAEFGFEDPAITGYVLAVISMFYPFFGKYVSINPNFEDKQLDLDMHIEGKIRVHHLFLFALHLLLDKNVRMTIMHFRKLKI